MSDPLDPTALAVGTPVIGSNGTALGTVREAHPHYLLVHHEGEHGDLDVPVHAILRIEDGKVYVSINRDSATPVDDDESAHRTIKDNQG